MKKFCKKLLPIFLKNILYKILSTTNFVRNTCKIYNFVGNDYPRKNYLPIKILRKISKKNLFLKIFLTNLQEKFHVIQKYLTVFTEFVHSTFEWNMRLKAFVS